MGTTNTQSNVETDVVRGVGTPEGRFARETIRFTGATGNVGTLFGGIPNTTATRLATGRYKVDTPNTKRLTIIPAVSIPTQYTPTGLIASGVQLKAEIVEKASSSGTFEVHTFAPTPSGVWRHSNPVANTELDLLFFIEPLADF